MCVRLYPVTSCPCWCFDGCVFVGLFLVSVCCEGRLVWGVKCAGCLICGVGCWAVCVFCVCFVFLWIVGVRFG